MTHDPWKGILLHAVEEFASDYVSLLQSDLESAREQIEEVAQMFIGKHPSLKIEDLQDYVEDPQAQFYLDLLHILKAQTGGTIGLQAQIAYCGWTRRHADPRRAIRRLLKFVSDMDVPATLRSTAGYELAQAYRKIGKKRKAIEWLRISAAAAEEAGNEGQISMIRETLASWEATLAAL